MRLAALVVIALVCACTRMSEEAPASPPARADVTLETVKLPPETSAGQISGLVTSRQGGAVMLDSGGPNPIPLRFGAETEVTVDGRPGSGDQIREGDLVRAAYQRDKAGEPVALQVVANSRPVDTDRVQPPAVPQQAPAASAPSQKTAGAQGSIAPKR